MKKYLLIAIFLVILKTITYAQWEFQYFDLKLGITHHMLSPQPDTLNNLFVNTPDGQMRMFPTEKFVIDYVPGINAGLHFHIDFQNDNGGFIIGLEYFNCGMSSKYENFNKKYSLIVTKKMHGVGIPIYVKFGNEIFDKQFYFFAGMQYNINLNLQTVEQVSWLTLKATNWKKNNNEYLKNNTVFFLGINYMIANFELDYMNKNFLNPDYLYNVGTTDNKINIFPNKVQAKSLFFFKTSVNIPLSPWTTKKNYKLHRLVKRLGL